MNNTRFESGDQEGMTQHPPVVNWRSSGVGVGVIVGVGCGVAVGHTVGETTAVGVAEASGAGGGSGTLDVQAANTVNPITQHAMRNTDPASAFILRPYRLRYQSGGHGAR